jgi:integrase
MTPAGLSAGVSDTSAVLPVKVRMGKSSQTVSCGKDGRPGKPYPDFPLFPHATGRWAKKIRGRLFYFGKWRGAADDGWQAAVQLYQQQRDDLHAGRTPRPIGTNDVTLRELANRFLTDKQRLCESGDIAPRTFADYYSVCERVINYFGAHRFIADITAEDFSAFRAAISKTRGPVALSNDITRVRIMFKWGFDSGLLDRPIRYGQGFQKPSRKTLRLARQARGPRMFSANEIQQMLGSASVALQAMILLAVNCGFGNRDCATLPLSALDLKQGWINHPRPKTGVPRRCPLWAETRKAVKNAIAWRPRAKDEEMAKLVFITSRCKSWAKDQDDNPISKETAKLLKELGLHRPGLNFYALRHTFETIGGETRDQVAVDAIMGHAPDASDMGSVYRERIADERLRAVTDHVRKWLFGTTRSKTKRKSNRRRKAR